MNILDKIVVVKRREVAERKVMRTIQQLESSSYFLRSTNSLSAKLRNAPGLITEFKRKSPSKSEINMTAKVEDIARAYELGGASGMSVLTDAPHFGGSESDFLLARNAVDLPLLRKDFTIDEYQVVEAKSIGADVILLIAAILTPKEIKSLASLAKSLELEVLLEVHNEEELNRSLTADVAMVGVNNRNLKTFEVSIDTSLQLLNSIPAEFVRVSESGLNDEKDVLTLAKAGYNGFLIGEHFMRQDNVQRACFEMVTKLGNLNTKN